MTGVPPKILLGYFECRDLFAVKAPKLLAQRIGDALRIRDSQPRSNHSHVTVFEERIATQQTHQNDVAQIALLGIRARRSSFDVSRNQQRHRKHLSAECALTHVAAAQQFVANKRLLLPDLPRDDIVQVAFDSF
jgi:hypothetical protein